MQHPPRAASSRRQARFWVAREASARHGACAAPTRRGLPTSAIRWRRASDADAVNRRSDRQRRSARALPPWRCDSPPITALAPPLSPKRSPARRSSGNESDRIVGPAPRRRSRSRRRKESVAIGGLVRVVPASSVKRRRQAVASSRVGQKQQRDDLFLHASEAELRAKRLPRVDDTPNPGPLDQSRRPCSACSLGHESRSPVCFAGGRGSDEQYASNRVSVAQAKRHSRRRVYCV
jgi:hypothetical protein